MTRIRQQPRRASLFVLVTFCVLLAALISRASDTAQATSGGSPYDIPLVTDTNPAADIVETTITAAQTNEDIGNGVTAHAQTFNGTIPGPTFKLHVGDTVIVHFKNDLTRVTGIHWHGIELENTMDGTPFTQNQVEPGGTFTYKFKVSRPGLYWYHPHHHSSTNNVFKGLYGMIIVTDPNEAALVSSGTLPSAAQTYPIVLSDMTVCKAAPGNDDPTYDPSLPWIGGGPLPDQNGPTPKSLCETAPIDDDSDALTPAGTTFNEGDIPGIQIHSGFAGSITNEGQTVLTNGKNVGSETLDVAPGEGVRLQFVNAATTRYMRLRLTDGSDPGDTLIPLVRVGGEGGLIDQAVVEGGVTAGGFDTQYTEGEILLPPGTRADVVAAIPAGSSGPATIWTEDYQRTGGGEGDPLHWSHIPTVPVIKLNITGAAGSFTIGAGTPLASTGTPVEVIGSATGALLDPNMFSPTKLGLASQDIHLGMSAEPAPKKPLGIDGFFGTHDVSGDYTTADHLGSTRYAHVGDTLELQTTNTTAAHHPFHLHGFSMQPISLTKSGDPSYIWPYHEFRDNIDIPSGYTLTFRIKITERPLADGTTTGGALGRWVFHCHIFFHATLGMLGELVVTDADGNEKPYVNADDTQTAEVATGDMATMTGTFSDPDAADTVTLSSSVGTVMDAGGGTWTWSNTAMSSELVYITATDNHGHQDQAVFKQLVTNQPPVADAGGPYATDEGTSVALDATGSTDPNGDALTYEWDLDNDGLFDDATGASPSFTPGDDGSFPISVKVTDPASASDTDSSTVTVGNVAPTATIDESSAVLINGIPTIVAEAGVPALFSGRTQDPGSDDLLTTWHWGDATPDTATLSLNDAGFNPDPDPSPTINPRDVTDNQSHTFGDACLYTTTFSSADDDSGLSPTDTIKVLIGGNALAAIKSDQWKDEFDRRDHSQFTDAQLNCYLAIVAYASNVFNETRDASTITAALVVLRHKEPVFMTTEVRELDQELLAAWLNFANGGLGLAQPIDTDHSGTPDSTFAAVMANAETIRNNPLSTKNQLKDQRSLLQLVNDNKA